MFEESLRDSLTVDFVTGMTTTNLLKNDVCGPIQFVKFVNLVKLAACIRRRRIKGALLHRSLDCRYQATVFGLGIFSMPHKLNEDRRHKIPKQIFKVTNWAAYNESLRQRGDFTVSVSGISKLMSVEIGVPDFSTLSRRGKGLILPQCGGGRKVRGRFFWWWISRA
jgi:hypothetical protein